MLKNIIVEGIDRLGKTTLIEGLLNNLGFMQVVHYERPRYIQAYMTAGKTLKNAQEAYQRDCFNHMFRMLELGNFILDRAHLGEEVYASLYRKYPGNYVFEQELDYPVALDNTLLVLLKSDHSNFIVDDGLSHDWSQRKFETAKFDDAFERSNFKHKLKIDVSHRTAQGSYEYADKTEILHTVLKRYRYAAPTV